MAGEVVVNVHRGSCRDMPDCHDLLGSEGAGELNRLFQRYHMVLHISPRRRGRAQSLPRAAPSLALFTRTPLGSEEAADDVFFGVAATDAEHLAAGTRAVRRRYLAVRYNGPRSGRHRPLFEEHKHIAPGGEFETRERLAINDLRRKRDIALPEQTILTSGPQQILIVPKESIRTSSELVNLFIGHGGSGEVPDMHTIYTVSLVIAAIIVGDCDLRGAFALCGRRP